MEGGGSIDKRGKGGGPRQLADRNSKHATKSTKTKRALPALIGAVPARILGHGRLVFFRQKLCKVNTTFLFLIVI